MYGKIKKKENFYNKYLNHFENVEKNNKNNKKIQEELALNRLWALCGQFVGFVGFGIQFKSDLIAQLNIDLKLKSDFILFISIYTCLCINL